MAEQSTGSLAVLNTGAGDIHIAFNNADEAETARAIAMLQDMQQRGYAVMVRRPDGTYTRAVSIDAETSSYVVLPPAVPATEPTADDACDAPPIPSKRRGRPRGSTRASARERLPIASSTAVTVARSAGGCDRTFLHRLSAARGHTGA